VFWFFKSKEFGWNRGFVLVPLKIQMYFYGAFFSFYKEERESIMKITLKDNSVLQMDKGVTPFDVASSLSQGLKKAAIAAKINGVVKELNTKLEDDCNLEILTFEDEEGKHVLRHTASHVLAQAVKRLYPKAKVAIGPPIENGFYYDFDVEIPFTQEDLKKIEKEMTKILQENIPLERFELNRNDAVKLMQEKGEDYKVELISELPEGETISFYRQGDYTDLCQGAHLISTAKVKNIKLLKTAGAYWRGDENKKMLQRIYGTAFEKKPALLEYLEMLKEAEKRDHNKLGRELKYFTTSPVVGQGLPLIMPKGAKVLQILQRFVEDEEEKRGYLLTKTPSMAKSDLYKMSGHWDHYRDGMFVLGDEEKGEEVLALRPMTCPFQFMIYKAGHHSYRELPLRYSENAALFRNESSGEMHGLIRVRQFTLSDAHLIVTPEQIEEEFKGVLDLIVFLMTAIGIQNDVTYRFSKWDSTKTEKYIDNPEAWEFSQNMMRKILDDIKLKYYEADDEAAFYGPKLDVQFKNVYGKEDTLFTIQIDFALAERFDMYYVDKNGDKQRPYIIHRASLGCYERTLAVMLEKYAGALPLWVSPEQVRFLPITDRAADMCNEWVDKFKEKGVRVTADLRSEKIGYKIREARNERIPYMLVVGDNEVDATTFAVRKRGEGDLGPKPADEVFDTILKEIEEKTIF
jgi:threonyl-tRNA synthetase